MVMVGLFARLKTDNARFGGLLDERIDGLEKTIGGRTAA